MISPLPTFFKSLPSGTFKFSVTTTSTNETFTLPLLIGTHNFTVNWGDGTSDSTVTAYTSATRVHTYATAGTRTITMVGTCIAFGFNNAGDKLKVTEIIDFIGDMGFTTLNFNGCTNLTAISSNMKELTSLTTAENIFRDCTKLTSIPTDAFSGSTKITRFFGAFRGCSDLRAIPANLFKYNTIVTSFEQTFYGCNDAFLTTIPTDLFRYNDKVTTFKSVFFGTTRIGAIPTDLFRYNLLATNFQMAFHTCFRLTTIPTELFKYNVQANDFIWTFYGCDKLCLNASIFYAPGEENTRFLNKSVKFTECFTRTSFTGVQGEAPAIWNCNFGTGTVTATSCYSGAGNSTTSLSNYSSIPSEWILPNP
jgi:hypothetical protein